MTSATATVDVVVVGAGPAGLTTAIACAQRGLSVRVLDRRREPIDKACGEGLMPDAVSNLERLGVELPPHRPLVGIRYLDGGVRADGRFPGRPGAGVRRTDLERALLARARSSGIDVRESTQVMGLRPVGASRAHPRWAVEIDDGPVAARWIVAADGLHSPLRRWSGLARPARRRAIPRFGIRRHVRIEPWTDLVEVHWSDRGEAYVTPVADDVVGIAVLWGRPPSRSRAGASTRPPSAPSAPRSTPDRSERSSMDEHLAAFPALAARIKDGAPASRVMAAGPLRQRARGVVSGNLVLVGDASGYLDAITGEGMALAFHQALDVADCVERGDLRGYPAAHAHHRRLPDLVTEATLLLSRHPGLRHVSIGVLARNPWLFDEILAVHAKEASAAAVPAAIAAHATTALVPRFPS